MEWIVAGCGAVLTLAAVCIAKAEIAAMLEDAR